MPEPIVSLDDHTSLREIEFQRGRPYILSAVARFLFIIGCLQVM